MTDDKDILQAHIYKLSSAQPRVANGYLPERDWARHKFNNKNKDTMNMKQNVTKFEAGKTYIMVSPCNTDARWKLKVVSRTEKTITVTGRFLTGEQTKKLRISVTPAGHYGMLEETCKPLGNYSLSPTLRATATTEDFKIIYGY